MKFARSTIFFSIVCGRLAKKNMRHEIVPRRLKIWESLARIFYRANPTSLRRDYRIHEFYFRENCTYDGIQFDMCNSFSRKVFNRIYNEVYGEPFFVKKIESLVKPGIHTLQRVTSGLGMMACGVAADSIEYYCRLTGPFETK